MKRDPVIGYDPDKYTTERSGRPPATARRCRSRSSTRKGFKKDGTAAMPSTRTAATAPRPTWVSTSPAVSLLDRGMVYVLAHIRGGQEMGRKWYDDGKLFNKKNTFTDFIDVTDFLVKEGYASKDRVAAYGGSAGGLLMGAIANMAPRSTASSSRRCQFVDVVTTMLDPSIPLTTNEYDEWGNPEKADAYAYMLSYSLHDNLKAQAYPAMFVGTGLWDSQVQYFEPAKYVARLRDLDTAGADHPVLFRINMDAGHGGKSGRFRATASCRDAASCSTRSAHRACKPRP